MYSQYATIYDDLQRADFFRHPEDSRQQINQWVESMTDSKIKNLIRPQDVDEFTSMILVNAAYLKGRWRQEFQFTIPDSKFFVKPNQPRKANMMFVSGLFNVGDESRLDSQVLEIPFSGEKVSMIIFLPNTNVEDLLSKLTYETLNTWYQSTSYQYVDIQVPEFKVE